MISVETALELVKENCRILATAAISVEDSCGLVLAEQIISPINMPPFRQSAMDGYAIHLTPSQAQYKICGEIAAGKSAERKILKPGECVRIFTGAMVPNTANVVVPQENVVVQSNLISLTKTVKIGENIRPKGEQTKKLSAVLEEGHLINPATVGLLLGLGITTVSTYRPPKISIITTGNELVPAGNPLPVGKVYESNSLMLKTALKASGYNLIESISISDEYDLTLGAISACIKKSDVVILSGGISVGDYDYVGKALKELEVNQVFYKVKQKPGKPLFFGKKNNTLIFALPGNPAAALTCFYVYVLRALNLITKKSNTDLTSRMCELKQDYTKKGDRAQFLKAQVLSSTVEILDGQNSSMLHTYANSNALAYVPEDKFELKKGQFVKTYLLPHCIQA